MNLISQGNKHKLTQDNHFHETVKSKKGTEKNGKSEDLTFDPLCITYQLLDLG